MKTLLLVAVFILTSFTLSAQSLDTTDARNVKWQSGALTIDNFKTMESNDSSSFGATTCSQMAYRIWYKNKHVRIWIQNYFSFNKSWMKEWARERPDILIHEQGHFNINEIQCRRFAQQLRNTSFTNNFNNEILSIFNKIEADADSMQHLYDQETGGCDNPERQSTWSTRIDDYLKSLLPANGSIIEFIVK